MFGIPYANLDLALLPQYVSEVPVGLQTVKQYLIHNGGFKTKGIFRTASQQNTYRDAMEALDMGERISEIKGMSVLVASQVLKAWFREYPVRTPGFLHVKLLESRLKDDLIREFNKIKEPLRTIVLWLIDLAVEVSEYEKLNSMNLESLAICLSPNLIRHEDDSTFVQYQRSAQTVFHSLCNLRKDGKLPIYAQKGDKSNSNNNNSDENSSGLPLTPNSSEMPKGFDVTDMSDNIASTAIEEDMIVESTVTTDVTTDETTSKSDANIDEKGDSPDAINGHIGYSSELRHKRKKRRSSIVYASSVHELYRPSLNTGVFGTVFYPKRDIYTTIRRESALHTKEVVYQALDIQRNPAFRLQYIADEIDAKLDLTEEENEKIREFGAILKERYNYENVLRSELVRYVIGSKGRIAFAERRFLNMKKLEREYNLNDIQLHRIRDELKQPRYVVCGKDVQGRSVLGINIAHFTNIKSIDLSIIIKAAMIYCDALTSDLDVCRNGIVLLFDMQGFKIEHLNSGLEKVFFSAFNDTYPLRIKRFIIVNAPIYIRGLINLLKVLLSKKLGNRIVSCKSDGGDKKGSLWKEIDRKEAPRCVDGTFDTENDGTYPTNAWSFVCSKISGDLPPMTAENLAEHPYPPNSNAKLPPDLSFSPQTKKEREISLSDHKWLKVKDGSDGGEDENSNNNSNENTTPVSDNKGSRFSGLFDKARNRISQARLRTVNSRDNNKTNNDNSNNNSNGNNNDNNEKKTNGNGVAVTINGTNETGNNGQNSGKRSGGKSGKKKTNNLTIDANKAMDASMRSDAVVITHKYKNRNEKNNKEMERSNAYLNSGNLSPQSMDSMISKSLPMPSETETEDRLDVVGTHDAIPAISAFDLQANASTSAMRDVTAEAENKLDSTVIDVDLNPSDMENDNLNVMNNNNNGNITENEISTNEPAPKTPQTQTTDTREATQETSKNDYVSVSGNNEDTSVKDDYVNVDSNATKTSPKDSSDSKEKDAAYVTVDGNDAAANPTENNNNNENNESAGDYVNVGDSGNTENNENNDNTADTAADTNDATNDAADAPAEA